jgi:uncharacterized membrane protein (DUF2068 family)
VTTASAPEASAASVHRHPKLHAVDSPGDTAQRLTLRTIATFEAVKGVAALAACLGLLGLLHRDLHHLAVVLIGYIGLDPGDHYPQMVLDWVDLLQDTSKLTIVLVALVYAVIRIAEACGLWFQKVWGEWIGALSGAIYVPFEVRHLLLRTTFESALVLGFNVVVVLYLLWRLWRRKAQHHPA